MACGFAASASASTLIGSSVAVGSTGPDVTAVQAFLALNPRIYPEGLVTGHFGPLTQKAVGQFQVAYGISPVGSVGPITRAKMNSLISAGQGLDISGPSLSTVGVQIANTGSVMVNWTTDENSVGRVYYSTSPITVTEMTSPNSSLGISGTVISDNNYSTSHSISLPGLSNHATYYYTATSTDASGNVSMSNPIFFTTNY